MTALIPDQAWRPGYPVFRHGNPAAYRYRRLFMSRSLRPYRKGDLRDLKSATTSRNIILRLALRAVNAQERSTSAAATWSGSGSAARSGIVTVTRPDGVRPGCGGQALPLAGSRLPAAHPAEKNAAMSSGHDDLPALKRPLSGGASHSAPQPGIVTTVR